MINSCIVKFYTARGANNLCCCAFNNYFFPLDTSIIVISASEVDPSSFNLPDFIKYLSVKLVVENVESAISIVVVPVTFRSEFIEALGASITRFPSNVPLPVKDIFPSSLVHL